MHNPSLAGIQECLGKLDETWNAPRGWDSALADRIEEALTARDVDLPPIAQEIVSSLDKRLRGVDVAVKSAVAGVPGGDVRIRQAYRLGQISLAQLLISQSANRRTGVAFLEQLMQQKFRKYIEVLFDGDRSSSEVAALVGEATESASRKLQQLRLFGITDFRKESKKSINFLTFAARAAFADLRLRGKITEKSPVQTAVAQEVQAKSSVEEVVHGLRIVQMQSAISDDAQAIPDKIIVDASGYADKLEEIKRSIPQRFRGTPTFALRAAA